jgi:hypothetical protein
MKDSKMKISNLSKYTPNDYPEFLERNGDNCHLSQGLVVWNKNSFKVDLILGKICQTDYVALSLEDGMCDMDTFLPFDPNNIDIHSVRCNEVLKEEIISIIEDQEKVVNQLVDSINNGDLTLVHDLVNRFDINELRELL